MSHPEELKRLNAEVSSYLGHLSKSQLWVLSLYVLVPGIDENVG